MTETHTPLPCPFCGSPAEIEEGSDHHGTWFNLGCSRHWGHVRNPDHTNTCIAGRIYYTETDVPLAEALTAWNTRAVNSHHDLIEALREAEAAIAEYYRYWTGGETRGSYDGKPERQGLWNARYKARAILTKEAGHG